MTYGYQIPNVFPITVSGGIGEATGDICGKALGVGILAPDSATYDIEILDADGFGVFGRTNCSGNTTIECQIRFYNRHTIYITNATDGIYKVKVWYE